MSLWISMTKPLKNLPNEKSYAVFANENKSVAFLI